MRLRSLIELWPWAGVASLHAASSLLFNYAHLKSVRTKSCHDASGAPIPWYTYPAIEYLKQFDYRAKTVFEYGSGNSTLFWGARAARVISVEDSASWFEIMKPKVAANCELVLETDLDLYPDVIRRTGAQFDIIVVDGAARGHTRLKCSRVAVEHLREGGMVILDNSDWLPESARLLRDSGLIEVDMTGFAPISGHTQTTSLFLHRAFAFRPLGDRQPMPGPGAKLDTWEHPAVAEPPVVVCGGSMFGAVRRDDRVALRDSHGVREFRLLVSEPSQRAHRHVAIIDCRNDRVVLSLTENKSGTARLEKQMEALLRLPWAEFAAAINRHDKRRYNLDG